MSDCRGGGIVIFEAGGVWGDEGPGELSYYLIYIHIHTYIYH